VNPGRPFFAFHYLPIAFENLMDRVSASENCAFEDDHFLQLLFPKGKPVPQFVVDLLFSIQIYRCMQH
jgi:hypothetical protein